MTTTATLILAAGQGTRMRSSLPKVLHPVAGLSLVQWAVRAAASVSSMPPVVVVGYAKEAVQAHLGTQVTYVEQEQQLGTGHAVHQAASTLAIGVDQVVVLYSDMPLIQGTTLAHLADRLESSRQEEDAAPVALTMLTVERDDPQGFGRIIRDATGEVVRIVEEVECTPAEKQIRELNPGVYCFSAVWLWQNLEHLPRQKNGEYYITDMVEIATNQGNRVVTVPTDPEEVYGINDRTHLAVAAAALRRRIAQGHMWAGVTIVDPAATYIDGSVTIGTDTTILPGTHLMGSTHVGAGCTIGPNCQIVDSRIGDACRISYSVVEEARMDAGCEIGPFGHLRPGAHLAEGVHMGNFGEVKNSYLGPGVKLGHFSYIGDAHIDENVNIGAGTITCNFDGHRKNRTVIERDAFIGSDTMLVAPIHIGAQARTGAGSVVTRDVPPDSLVYGVPARLHPGSSGATQGGENDPKRHPSKE